MDILSFSQETILNISEPVDENSFAYKNKIHGRSELILFYFSALKLKYFGYLSLQSSVYDQVHDMNHQISTKMHIIV